MRLRWFVLSSFDMIVKCSDHYPGSALEVCVPPTDCRSKEYSVNATVVGRSRICEFSQSYSSVRASACVRSLLAARRLFWTMVEQDAMKIARVDGGLGGEVVFD